MVGLLLRRRFQNPRAIVSRKGNRDTPVLTKFGHLQTRVEIKTKH